MDTIDINSSARTHRSGRASSARQRKRSSLQRRLDAIASIADGIAKRDLEDSALIEKNKESIADKLAGVNKSRAAAQAYAGPRKSGARFQDREA